MFEKDGYPRKVGHFILTRQSGVFHLTDVANAVRWKTPDWRVRIKCLTLHG